MAPMRTKTHGPRKRMHFRRVKAQVEVGRKPYDKPYDASGKGAFIACVKIGNGNLRRGQPSNLGVCASGKNPRRAIATALWKAGAQIGRRSGSFAGLLVR